MGTHVAMKKKCGTSFDIEIWFTASFSSELFRNNNIDALHDFSFQHILDSTERLYDCNGQQIFYIKIRIRRHELVSAIAG